MNKIGGGNRKSRSEKKIKAKDEGLRKRRKAAIELRKSEGKIERRKE